MKRWLTGILVILFLALIIVYLLIPSKLVVARSVIVGCNADGADRFLGQEKNWAKWWPGPGYGVVEHLPHVISIKIPAGDSGIRSWVSVESGGSLDSTNLLWQCSLASGWNPFGRIRQYRVARSIGEDMDRILQRLRATVEKGNVYGTFLRVGGIQDSFLLSKKAVTSVAPSTEDIYGLIKTLKEYSSREGARETNYPMVNVTLLGKDQYQLMVALPVDRVLQPKEGSGFFSRKMVQGQFLITEVMGGAGKVDETLEQMGNYITDHRRTVMAIPFQSLVTDRSREADTSKWVTRIYYPIY